MALVSISPFRFFFRSLQHGYLLLDIVFHFCIVHILGYRYLLVMEVVQAAYLLRTTRTIFVTVRIIKEHGIVIWSKSEFPY